MFRVQELLYSDAASVEVTVNVIATTPVGHELCLFQQSLWWL